MATALTAPERKALAASHPAWTIEGEVVRRIFKFADFAAAMGFVTRVGLVAERADHHPDIDIRWNKVTLALSTHSLGVLSDLDRTFVATIDGWELT